MIELITVSNLTKKYGKTTSLDSISIAITGGTCYGLVGPNGAGKSTLMKILAGIVKDYDGTIEYEPRQPSIGYTPQDIVLEDNLKASSNLKFYGKISGLKGKELLDRSSSILKNIGLEDRADKKVKSFSGGMKRRLNIGCALMSNPDIIILDEPTVGVDPQSRRHIFGLINKLKNEGKTIIYASHYMEEIEAICDSVVFMDDGKIIEKGTVSELLNRHSKPSIVLNADIPKDWVNSDKMIQRKENEWVIMESEPLDKIIELANKCKENNVVPNQLSLVQPKLEEVFFSLTGTALRDEN